MMFEEIRKAKRIGLMAHRDPDGDAVGSVMAMYLVLKEMGKDVTAVLRNYAQVMSFIPEIGNSVADSDSVFDLVISLDTSSLDIIEGLEVFERARKTICIDHHSSNTRFADINYVTPNVPSTTQMLFDLFKQEKIEMTKEIGICLITGLLTDTGGFKYGKVTDKSFEMAAEIYRLGVDISSIYDHVLDTLSMSRFRLMQVALQRLEFLGDGKIAFTYITYDEFNECQAKVGDHEGIVDIGRSIDGVKVSIFIKENESDKKVSLRSKGMVDVSRIAMVFGGGGHMNAAGFNTKLNWEELKKRIIDEALRLL